jgi:zinc protease
MLAEGGTRGMTYKQILDAMFPMATSVRSEVDKEMITFIAATHTDNLEAFYKIFRAMLTDPGWREDDLKRLREDHINYLRVTLRGNNDEELGKEVLYNQIYSGTRFGHHNVGTVSSLEKLTLADLQEFYRAQFTSANLIIGIAGGYPADFVERMKKDFSKLAQGQPAVIPAPQPKPITGNQLVIIEKPTRSVAYSLGYPIQVRRGHPDFPALLVAQAYLGQHRTSGGQLYNRMREIRGLNYGDYAYIEYFPRGMFQFEPPPNIARQHQIFQIWIRPLEPPTAIFGLRLALFELTKFIREGLSAEDFERTRNYLSKYVNLLTKSKSEELGYAIDSLYYGIPDYNSYIKDGLEKLTLAAVNRAIKKHLRAGDIHFVAVTDGASKLRDLLVSGNPSPMKYNAPKPKDILEEDKTVETWDLGIKAANVKIVPVDQVFE